VVKKTQLKERDFYFQVYFNSPVSCVPSIRTIFYLGINIFDKKKRRIENEYYFQDAESYETKGSILERRYNPQKDFILPLQEKHLVMIFGLAGLIKELQQLKIKIPRMKSFKGKTMFISYSKLKNQGNQCGSYEK